jgi:hypothetical protein
MQENLKEALRRVKANLAYILARIISSLLQLSGRVVFAIKQAVKCYFLHWMRFVPYHRQHRGFNLN